jgi:3-deoxy-manno-octulosonate cytidylyltransferase (CMP-KDO synthetase)
VVRVLRSAENSQRLSDVYIATDDENIASVVTEHGGRVIMTDTRHRTGTDRVAEAASKIGEHDIVVNIQADEPFMTPDIIDKVVSALDDPEIHMSTACSRLENESEINDPNVVKVVLDKNGFALYFSRSLIPSGKYAGSDSMEVYGHLGIYGFKRDFLNRFASLERSSLEIAESSSRRLFFRDKHQGGSFEGRGNTGEEGSP